MKTSVICTVVKELDLGQIPTSWGAYIYLQIGYIISIHVSEAGITQ